MMTYDEMEREISEIPKFGAKASLSNLEAYFNLADHPEKNLRVIHVAGTNGKGSVCAFLESILRQAGYRTALFTSPHLETVKERFRINFQPCGEEELAETWVLVKKLMERGKRQGLAPLTYFEVLFFMAVLLFSGKEIDYCILETGLGGRLDATVLSEPVLSIITSISYDHMELLGNTIEEIAFEKAGIIKEGVPVVTVDEQNGAFPVIEARAKARNSKIYFIKTQELTILKKYENYIDFSIDCRYYKINRLTVKSCADYQVQNAALAVLAGKILLPDISEQVLQKGLLQMYWAGRMEEIAQGIYVDGAHNFGAVRQICHTVANSDKKWTLLFAVCKEKEYSRMISLLSELHWEAIYITKIDGARAVPVGEVEKHFARETDCPLRIFDTVPEAFDAALQHKKQEEHLLCLGSLYLVGEIKRCAGQYFGK